MAPPSETETVIKRILPYLRRRGYDEIKDFAFEAGATYTDRYDKGFIDILVTCGQPNPLFLVKAKRISRSLMKVGRSLRHCRPLVMACVATS